MPFVISKKDGKRFGANFVFTATEIGRLRDDAHCYTIINTTSRRVSKVGAACKKPTPENLWGARGRRRRGRGFRDAAPAAAPSASAPVAQKPVTPAMAGFFDKIFGKKPPKRNPMSRRIYMIKTKSGTYIPAGVASMQGARRRKRRRQR